MPMQPHVFVVMPYGVKEAQAAVPASATGPEQAAIHIDFNEIYQILIHPALTKAGCCAFRADEEPEAGDIPTDMFFELVTADLILVDISIPNANVFYELGVRHGVRSRGVFMIHGGWSRRTFDVAPDCTFDYDGAIFAVKKEDRDHIWQRRLDAETERLAAVLRAAVEADEKTGGSPVYSQLIGLKGVDWSDIRSARAKYFGDVYADWKGWVEVAKLNGWPGDILTLAEHAPTRFHRAKLLWHAADCLCSIERFGAAHRVLRELLTIEPDNRAAQTRLGLVLGRLGKVDEAKVHMLAVVEQYRHDPEAHGILGRLLKDLWRLEWSELPSVEERRRQAVATSSYAVSAIRSYHQAARKELHYYNGINVVSLVKLLDFLKDATGEAPAPCHVGDFDDLVAMVRFTARSALEGTGGEAEREFISPSATLAELELVMGAHATALSRYRDAANDPDTTSFMLKSMLARLDLFDKLEFLPDIVPAVREILESQKGVLEQGIPAQRRSRFGKVIVCSGHMIDMPGRSQERFPARKERVVRQRMAWQLRDWEIGPGDLAICGGACGSDIIFAELCHERGAEVWLLLPLPQAAFLEQSVTPAGSGWERRFFSLRERDSVKTFEQMERLKSPPSGTTVFTRNNSWIINTAEVEASDPKNLHALLVWDEEKAGDGPGGTSDFAGRIGSLGGKVVVINPVTLPAQS